MENTELIKALRCPYLGDDWCDEQECTYWSKIGCMEGIATRAAADALEAADKRIDELEKQIPKEAHWVAVDNGHGVCSNCNRQDSIDNMATHCRYCGARMTKGEKD